MLLDFILVDDPGLFVPLEADFEGDGKFWVKSGLGTSQSLPPRGKCQNDLSSVESFALLAAALVEVGVESLTLLTTPLFASFGSPSFFPRWIRN